MCSWSKRCTPLGEPTKKTLTIEVRKIPNGYFFDVNFRSGRDVEQFSQDKEKFAQI